MVTLADRGQKAARMDGQGYAAAQQIKPAPMRTCHTRQRPNPRPRFHWARCLAAIIAIVALPGCSMLGYYSHLAMGETHVLLARRSIDKVIADPATSPRLRDRLSLAKQARTFASRELKLPRNRSYLYYADIDRPFVMYNVFATPALSLKPVTHCFPIAGCVAYQGFYHHDRARAAADKLRQKGDDVTIGGVPAYSTLGHFADPILSSMNRWSTDELIGTIFHELAHQAYYLKGATAFNESFATFVQREGLRQWHQARHLPPPDPGRTQRRHQFTQLVLATRRRLKGVYASQHSDAEKHRLKHAAFEQLRQQYRQLRDTQWNGLDVYADWIDAPLNNAKLLPFGLYDEYVPAFAELFQQCNGQWVLFYQRVRAIGRGRATARKAFLSSAAPATSPRPSTPTRR